MPKRIIKLDDETSRMLDYYIAHSQKEEDEIINQIIKSFLIDHLSSNQIKTARQHKGKDSFSANDVLRNFGEWIQDE